MQKLNGEVLTDTLAPKFDDSSMIPKLVSYVGVVKTLPDGEKKSELLESIETGIRELQMADQEWQQWHSVLTTFVRWESSKLAQGLLAGSDLMVTVHTTTWAVLWASLINWGWCSFPVLVAALLVLGAAWLDHWCLRQYLEAQGDQFGVRLTADLLERLKVNAGTGG